MYRFYAPQINAPRHMLAPEESKHARQVLRLKKNDTIVLLDGKGKRCLCRIVNEHTKNTELLILEEHRETRPQKPNLTIAIAPTKSMDRFTNFLEKAVETGATKIIPIHCRYSERKTINEERLRKIAIAAMKQSGNLFLPEIAPLTKLQTVLKEEKASRKYIAHCAASDTKKPVKEMHKAGEDALFLIGPEGDFSQEEITSATARGFAEIRLTTHTLRTETAGIYACIAHDLINS